MEKEEVQGRGVEDTKFQDDRNDQVRNGINYKTSHLYLCYWQLYSPITGFRGFFLATNYFSQNHRMFGVGRDLCGSPRQTLLPKQGHLQQAAQDLVQAGLEYLQRRRLHHLPGQPVPVLRHPQREEVLPCVWHGVPVPHCRHGVKIGIAPCVYVSFAFLLHVSKH